MNLLQKYKRIIVPLICMILVISTFSMVCDISYTQTRQVDEVTLLDNKIEEHEETQEYDGYIVSIKDSRIDEVSSNENSQDYHPTESDKFYLVNTTEEALDFTSASSVEYIEPNYPVYPLGFAYPPNDPLYKETVFFGSIQKGGPRRAYEMMGIDRLWKNNLFGTDVSVAVLDTGYNPHQDMKTPGKMLKSPNSYPGRLTAVKPGSDIGGHGTGVTSLISATINNNKNIAGVAPGSNMISINVFYRNNRGEVLGSSYQLINAYDYLLKNGVPDVLNMSYGNDVYLKSMEDRLQMLAARGCILIAAAGNDGKSTATPSAESEYTKSSYPAAYGCVIGVGSVDAGGNISDFSSKNRSVDVCAWGDSVPILSAGNRTATLGAQGTSFAAPIVSGIASALKEANQYINVYSFREMIKDTSRDKGNVGWDPSYGYGIIDATAMLAQQDLTRTTITFNNNGRLSTKSYYVGNTYRKLPTPGKTGYTFGGWYKDKAYKTRVSAATTVKASDKTFYAKWTANKYTVKFNVNKGKKIKTKSKKVIYDKAMGTLPTPKRSGYNFLGWKSRKKGGVAYSKTKLYRDANRRTLYANWTRKKVAKYNANGGRISHYAKAVKKGKKYGSLPTPTRTGYKFKGWYTKKKGGKKITSGTKVKTNKNHTIYARWVKK